MHERLHEGSSWALALAHRHRAEPKPFCQTECPLYPSTWWRDGDVECSLFLGQGQWRGADQSKATSSSLSRRSWYTSQKLPAMAGGRARGAIFGDGTRGANSERACKRIITRGVSWVAEPRNHQFWVRMRCHPKNEASSGFQGGVFSRFSRWISFGRRSVCGASRLPCILPLGVCLANKHQAINKQFHSPMG